ncbi:MAG: hypothetical protein ABW092_08700 [Candidatus Thiodiazotropha sp.]
MDQALLFKIGMYLLFVSPVVVPLWILSDSKARLGKYSWGWALFAGVSALGLIQLTGTNFRAAAGHGPLVLGTLLGSLFVAYSVLFAMYRGGTGKVISIRETLNDRIREQGLGSYETFSALLKHLAPNYFYYPTVYTLRLYDGIKALEIGSISDLDRAINDAEGWIEATELAASTNMELSQVRKLIWNGPLVGKYENGKQYVFTLFNETPISTDDPLAGPDSSSLDSHQ